MSRIGKKPIQLIDTVKVSYKDKSIAVKGPKGELTKKVHPLVDIEILDNQLLVKPLDEAKKTKALQGLTRALIANMVSGVSNGFQKVMEISGIGYRAEAKGDILKLALGFSHPIEFPLPKGISAAVEKNKITLSGIDKEQLGQTAANIRQLRPPEPYKGKGIRYIDERIQRKAGKTGTK
jgi:large subunit ribosomal protein L6